MAEQVVITLEMPDDMPKLHLPNGVHQRLQELLDRQDRGEPLSPAEREEAEGLVNLADLFTLLRLRIQQRSGGSNQP